MAGLLGLLAMLFAGLSLDALSSDDDAPEETGDPPAGDEAAQEAAQDGAAQADSQEDPATMASDGASQDGNSQDGNSDGTQAGSAAATTETEATETEAADTTDPQTAGHDTTKADPLAGAIPAQPGDPVEVEDFTSGTDSLVILFDSASSPAPELSLADDGQDALVSLNGAPVMRVLGGAGAVTMADLALVDTAPDA